MLEREEGFKSGSRGRLPPVLREGQLLMMGRTGTGKHRAPACCVAMHTWVSRGMRCLTTPARKLKRVQYFYHLFCL